MDIARSVSALVVGIIAAEFTLAGALLLGMEGRFLMVMVLAVSGLAMVIRLGWPQEPPCPSAR